MNKCEVCYKLHKNKRFCSIKCRNSVVQKLAVIAKQKSQITTKCANCGLVKKTNSIARKYCSHKCFTDSRRSTTRPSSPCVICGRMMDHLRYKPDGKRDLRVRIVCSNSCRGKKAAQGRISPKWTDKRRANHMKSMPRGENHVFWRGGVTPWQKIERKKPEYARWRTLVLKETIILASFVEHEVES